MVTKTKIKTRIVFLGILILCFQGCLSFNTPFFKETTGLKTSSVIYTGIIVDALLSTNTSISGNWTWAETQPWCTYDGEKYIIEDMVIDETNTPTGSGIFINNSHDVDFRIENCTITNVNAITSYSAGIDIENSSRGVIFNNTISETNPIGCGIQILGYNCYNITIERNVVTNILRHGILAYGGDEIHVLNNTVNTVGYNGIYFYQGTQNSTIAYNFVNDTNYNQMSGANGGIKLLDGNTDNNEIYNNTVINCWRGIYLRDSSNNSIYNNTIKNNYDAGIVLSSFSIKNNVTDNLICNDPGITNQDRGIWIYDANNNSIRSNTVRNNQLHGIYVDFAKWTEIIDNTLEDNNRIGIYLYGYSNNCTIEENSINRNNLGIGLNHANFNNVTNNNILDNNYCIFEFESVNNTFTDNNCSESSYQNPIFIDGLGIEAPDWTWARNQPWCSGEGTQTNPYVIENLNMKGFGFGFNYGINILNSEAYLIIRNCSIYNYASGMIFTNVTNMIVDSNTCSDNNQGIEFFEDCNGNTLSENYCYNNEYGIYFDDACSNNTLIRNILSDNSGEGIYLDYECDNNTFVENTVIRNSYGICISGYCDNNSILNNIFKDNSHEAIYIESDCNDNLISENTISNNSEGIVLDSDCYRNVISNNFIQNHLKGIHLSSTTFNTTVVGNILKNNTIGVEIVANCENNSLYENFFLGNQLHALDDGTGNTWNTSLIGNYWDNWTSPDSDNNGIVDEPYLFIEGSAGSIDYLPIADDEAPQITILQPVDKSRYSDFAPGFTVVIKDAYLWEMWYTLDGGINNYTFTYNGTINQAAWDALPFGEVTIRFYASDKTGKISMKEVTVVKYDAAQQLRRRILFWTLLGVAAVIGMGSFYLIKIWKIKLEE